MKDSIFFSLIALFLCISSICCHSKESYESVLDSDDIVVFIESRSPAHGIRSGNFGEVVLMDINTGKKYYLPDDDYYFNRNPIISYDGNYVAFLSNRVGSRSELRIKGVGGPHEIYLYDVRARTLERFGEELTERYPEIFGRLFRLLKWNTTSDGFYLRAGRNKIYEVPITQDTIKYVTSNEDENVWIESFSISVDGRYMLMSTRGHEPKMNRLILYDIEKDSKKIIIESDYYLLAGAWSANSKKFLFSERGVLYEYNLIEGITKVILENTINEDMGIAGYLFYTRNENPLFVGSRNGSTEILKYHIDREEIEFITNNGYPKWYLDVSF